MPAIKLQHAMLLHAVFWDNRPPTGARNYFDHSLRNFLTFDDLNPPPTVLKTRGSPYDCWTLCEVQRATEARKKLVSGVPSGLYEELEGDQP